MNSKLWLLGFVGVAALAGGVFVFLQAKPNKKESDDVGERKAGDFDGEKALKYLEDVCAIGPRISGSEGMKKQQTLLQTHFEKLGATVTYQKFEGTQPSQEKSVPMANMIISFHPEAKKRVIICGHYDTRPLADRETNVRNWRKPFVSANDGGSTLGFMMELGNHVKNLKMNVGLDFIIFDGEEFINDPQKDKFFLGSEYFGEQYRKNPPEHKYSAAILLDLFAGRDAKYSIEQNSKFLAGELVEDIWNLAEELKVTQFEKKEGPEVLDDHIALNRAKIPCIDIIDFEYMHWHLLSDLPEQCSPKSFAAVAKVLMAWLQKVK